MSELLECLFQDPFVGEVSVLIKKKVLEKPDAVHCSLQAWSCS